MRYSRAILSLALSFLLALLGGSAAAQVVAHAGPDATICGGGPVTLGATAAATGGQGPYQYSWYPTTGLNDPSLAHPICTTTSTQTYTLTVMDANNLTATDAVTVTVLPTANAAITSSVPFTVFNGISTFYKCSSQANSLFNFSFDGTAATGSTHTINWGDGTPNFSATGSSWPTEGHSYGQGIYTLTYSIVQPNGCNASRTYSVFLGSTPAIGIGSPGNTSGCGPFSITFPITGTSNNTSGTIYTVTFNDGSAPQTFNHPPPASVTHLFATSSCGTTSSDGVTSFPNSFQANLTAQNPCGISASAVVPIVVSTTPVTDFTISPNDTVCTNSNITFTSTSTGIEIQGNSCSNSPALLWDIQPATGWSISSGTLGNSNGYIGTAWDPSSWIPGSTSMGLTFSTPGAYSIRLRSGNGCGGDTLTRIICVEAPPEPAFLLSPTTGCSPLVSTTVNNSTSPNSCSTRYNWLANAGTAACGGSTAVIFSGGTSATSNQPQFTFTGAGSYTVSLRAINSCGTFPVDQVVTVGAPPQVSVNAVNGICEGQSVTPSATFTACGSPITGYSWALPGGNPSSANTQNLGGIIYSASGNFNITATANSACGNTTASTPLSVTSLPAAPVVGGPITLCVGETLNLTATAVPGITFTWIGPGGFTSTSTNPSIPNVTLANQGVYSVTASAGGCSGPSSTVTVTVNPAPVVSISPTVPTVCAGNAVTLTASGGTNYQWIAGGVTIGSGSPFTFTPTATTTVVLHGDAGGCTGASSTLVTVYPLPVVDAGPDRVFCESNLPQMLFPDTYPGTWSGDPNVTANGYFTPTTQGTFQLTYTVISPQGCSNTDVIQVTVNPPSTPANAGPDTLLCQNAGAIQLVGTPAGGTWSGDISISGLFNPVNSGTFTVTYFVGTGSCSSTDQAVVTVVPAPVVNPGQDQQVCIDAAAFTLSATPLGGSWSGAGISGNQFDPQAAGAGQHAVSYTYADPNGCSTTGIRTITVNPLPVVFAGNDITFCDQPFAQTLAGYSPLGGTWSGPGVTANGNFTPTGPGTFDLVYAFSDANGCASSDQLQVTVITIDDPASAGNDTTLCLNSGQLQLVGGPAGGTWSGPHVDVDGLFDPAVDGSFTLTYSVGNGSCITLDQVEITVLPLPVIDITIMDDACIDAGEQTFAATPAGGMWSGTGITDAALGTFDPALSDVGTFTITYTFTDASGCTNSTTGDVEVSPLPIAAFSNDPTACTNVSFHFTDESTGASSWSWDLGDATSSTDPSPDHTYTTAGSYTVTLTATSAAGCTSTISHDVTVWAGPTVAFDLSPVEGCGPLEVLLDNQSFGDGVTYDWDFGDGTGSTLEQPGQNTYYASLTGDTIYSIVLTASNYCGSVDSTRTVTVHPAPTAIFGPDFDSGCSPWPVTFSNVTIGQADSYFWDFGDGFTSTTTDSLVHHTYYAGAEDTAYTITLVATNACGSDTANYTITTSPNTITAFFNTDTTSGCAPLTVNFTQYSIGVTNWHWDLGNGEVSTAANVSMTYNTAGTYTATLYGDNGCSFDTASVQIVVLDSPPADFDITGGLFCAGSPVQFTNNTPSPAGLNWDFGDGNTSTLSTPAHSYASPGSYNVTLTVASALNPCPAVLTQTVTVLTTPVASFTPDPASGCIPLAVQFTNGSTSADFHQWNFGDGNTSSAPNPAHTFTAAGTYTVQLIAENLNGCTDTASANVVAFPLPVSAFTMAAGQSCVSPTSLQLSNASSGAVDHAWDLGNGTSSILNNPVATYTEPGSYTITLTVSNQYGCTDVSTDQFIVHPTPVAQFTVAPQPACASYPVTFGNTSLNSQSYVWAFGDGESSMTESPLHTYPEGDYDVTLIATGAGGCNDTVVVPNAVHVDPTPTAAFSYEAMQSTTYALQFHNESVDAITWIWDFGDGEYSTEYQPLHLFPAGPDDLYPLCLVAINSFGCPDTLCQPVVATSEPDVYAANAFTPDQDGLNETFLPVLNGFENWRYQFFIFDRWGEMIHDSRDRYTPWDGTYKGKPVKTDVYVWKVVLNRQGDERVFYGHVTVVRGTE